MKLLCLTGQHKEKEFAIPATGMRLGRAADNELVLGTDPDISRHHACIEPDGKGWQLVDTDSSNGVFLNGQRVVGKAQLKTRDEIRMGRTQFLFIDEREDGGTPFLTIPPAPAAPPPDAVLTAPETTAEGAPAADVPGADPASADPAKTGARRRILLLVIVLLAVTLVPLALILVRESRSAATRAAVVTRSWGPADLHVYYENLEASPKSLFRYELTLAKGTLQITVDDVLNDRRVEEPPRKLTPEQLEILASSLLTEEFLTLKPGPAERRNEGFSRTRLLIQCGDRGNYAAVENGMTPEPFTAAVQTLITFVQSEMGIYAEPMPREEAMRLSQEDYANAKRLFDERTVDPGNLYRAVKLYRQVLERLKRYDDKPDWFAKAHDELAAAEQSLDTELSELLRNALTLKSAGNLEDARQALLAIRAMVPDWDHEVARKARQNLLAIEQMLTQKQKKR